MQGLRLCSGLPLYLPAVYHLGHSHHHWQLHQYTPTLCTHKITASWNYYILSDIVKKARKDAHMCTEIYGVDVLDSCKQVLAFENKAHIVLYGSFIQLHSTCCITRFSAIIHSLYLYKTSFWTALTIHKRRRAQWPLCCWTNLWEAEGKSVMSTS